MRLLSFALALALFACALAPGRAALAAVAHDSMPADAAAPAMLQEADDGEDRVVEVQLAVLGAAIVLVVVIGGAGYFLRKRLGLVAPPPDQSQAGHH